MSPELSGNALWDYVEVQLQHVPEVHVSDPDVVGFLTAITSPEASGHEMFEDLVAKLESAWNEPVVPGDE